MHGNFNLIKYNFQTDKLNNGGSKFVNQIISLTKYLTSDKFKHLMRQKRDNFLCMIQDMIRIKCFLTSGRLKKTPCHE
jgi:hypothetical protein